MNPNEPISHIMTSQVETVQHTQSLSVVRRILSENEINHIPVLDGRRLVGLISSTDLMKLNIIAQGPQELIHSLIDRQYGIDQVMHKNPICLNVSNTVRDAAEKLAQGRFHSLPVVNDDHHLEGIVTSTDLIRYLLAQY